MKTFIGFLMFLVLFLCMGLLINHANAAPIQYTFKFNVTQRIGSVVTYYGNCTASAFYFAPGDPSDSLLNVTACQTVTTQTSTGPSWILSGDGYFSTVWLPSGTFHQCALIHSQLILAGINATQNITMECIDTGQQFANVILVNGFDG